LDSYKLTNDKALETLIKDMKRTGHILERRMRGPRSMDIEAGLEYGPNKSREQNREAASNTIRGQAALFCIKCKRLRRQEDFNKWAKVCVPRKKPGVVVSENFNKRKEMQREMQKEIVQKAIKDAEADMAPSKRGRFDKYEVATKEEDAHDADEANLDKPIEPVLKKKKLEAPETESKHLEVKEEEKLTK